MNWKELFDEDRLDRGYKYYQEGKVFDVILTEDTITSKVEGSRSNIYEVKIVFNQDLIDSMYCTCPYCYADFNCKHMVATLYKKDEISSNTLGNIIDENYDDVKLFADILKNIDETKLKRYLFDKFSLNKNFTEDFINTFQEQFTPEDFDNYENMLENIFNIDVVELYNENGFYHEMPFQKYLESFLNDKISLLYKKEEYDYVLQLLYIIYENIATKVDVTQYIEIHEILKTCNYYISKIIDLNDKIRNEEIYSYLISKIKYDYNKYTTEYFIDICLTKFNNTQYLKDLNQILTDLINEFNVSDNILLYKYELIETLDYPTNTLEEFLYKYNSHEKIMDKLVDQKIKTNDYVKAIELLNENKEIHGDTYKLENNLLLLELYKITNDYKNAIEEILNILYDYNIKDLSYIEDLKELTNDKWLEYKDELIEFYKETYAYEFLNKLYVYEEDYEELFSNVMNNCQINTIEEYRIYYEDNHSKEILLKYNRLILDEAKEAKTIAGYSVITKYLEIMTSYKNSSEIVKELIKVLKNKYSAKKLLMEKIEEIEAIYL